MPYRLATPQYSKYYDILAEFAHKGKRFCPPAQKFFLCACRAAMPPARAGKGAAPQRHGGSPRKPPTPRARPGRRGIFCEVAVRGLAQNIPFRQPPKASDRPGGDLQDLRIGQPPRQPGLYREAALRALQRNRGSVRRKMRPAQGAYPGSRRPAMRDILALCDARRPSILFSARGRPPLAQRKKIWYHLKESARPVYKILTNF